MRIKSAFAIKLGVEKVKGSQTHNLLEDRFE
jgi:hypothetical protein